MQTLEHSLLKDEKLQSILTEENTMLKDTESRWTKEGLLDIREEDHDEDLPVPSKPVVIKEEEDDDDFETQLRKNKEKLKGKTTSLK